MAKATVNIALDADLVIEVMVLSGVRNAQDAVELIVRDYVQKGSRTEARVGDIEEYHRPQMPVRDPNQE